MATNADYDIADTLENQKARERLKHVVSLGVREQNRLIAHCASSIPSDSYVHPSLMEFGVQYIDPKALEQGGDNAPVILSYSIGPVKSPHSLKTAAKIHQHALGQLCDLVGLPRIWLNKLNVESDKAWRRDMLVEDLNTLFKKIPLLNARKRPAEFLHRKVGNELRAVLTQSYNRHLVSNAVLQPFLEVCSELGLKPASAVVTDLKVGLQTYLPFAFEPIPGEFIAIGAWWGNSDFGQGKLRISHTVMRIDSGSSILAEDSFSRVHLSAIVTDSDVRLSDDVAVKELDAIAAATKSAVRSAIEPAQVQKLLNAITQAHEAKIPWSTLKKDFSKFLSKEEVVSMEDALNHRIQELPPPGVGSDGQPLPSRWWAAAALAHLASKQMDEGRSADIKQAAGKFLEE